MNIHVKVWMPWCLCGDQRTACRKELVLPFHYVGGVPWIQLSAQACQHSPLPVQPFSYPAPHFTPFWGLLSRFPPSLLNLCVQTFLGSIPIPFRDHTSALHVPSGLVCLGLILSLSAITLFCLCEPSTS